MKEKIALVTGANKGIGFGIAKHLGLSGWKVILGARNRERAEKAIGELVSTGVDIIGWTNIELTDPDSLEQAAREVGERFSGLSLLVNNAGIPGDMSVDSQHTEIGDIRKTLEVNFIVASKAAQNAMMGVMATEFEQNSTPVEIFSVHPGPTTTDLNGNMALPGFHDIETVGRKTAELINDGQNHQGEFIELYPIVKEN